MEKIKHVLGLSGGKDSSALALHMKETRPDLEIEYFFTDTGYELPETIEFIEQLATKLGQPIHMLNTKDLQSMEGRGDLQFSSLLKKNGNYLPSQRDRWCTVELKLKPFERWVGNFISEGYKIKNYVGIRADERERSGFMTIEKPIETVMPFREDGIVKSDIVNILRRNGLDLPKYYDWRSRSGCTFCFYQQKIEWIRLMERHPDLFEQAKQFEKSSAENSTVGERFYWMGKNEPLETLEDPERQAQIRENHEKKLARFNKKKRPNTLLGDENLICVLTDIDEIYDTVEGGGACITCYK